MIFGNIGDTLKKVKEMQAGLKKIQKELKDESYQASAEGVICVVSGDMELKELKIDPKLVSEGDAEKLQSLVSEAVSNAMKEAKDKAMQKMKGLTGGLDIPGLF